MAIRDRGKMKWQFAFGMPELIRAQRDMWRETERIVKPIIDEYEKEEFDSRISYAMEYNFEVKLTVWNDGFNEDYTGRIHYVDPLTRQLRIKVQPDGFERIAFDSILGVNVIDQ
jgi:hypothetical protein